MRRALDVGHKVLVIVRWMVGVTAGFIAVLALVVGIAWFFNRDPSAESEVRK